MFGEGIALIPFFKADIQDIAQAGGQAAGAGNKVTAQPQSKVEDHADYIYLFGI